MTSKKEAEENMGKLTSAEILRIRFITNRLIELSENTEINEDNLNVMNNILEEVRSLREMYLERILYQYKRGFIL